MRGCIAKRAQKRSLKEQRIRNSGTRVGKNGQNTSPAITDREAFT